MGAVPAVAVLVVALGVPLGALVWQLGQVGLGAGFVIRRKRDGSIAIRGRIPRSKFSRIREFCQRDLDATGPFTIRGSFRTRQMWKLRMSGRLNAGQRQQIRNFLAQVLR